MIAVTVNAVACDVESFATQDYHTHASLGTC